MSHAEWLSLGPPSGTVSLLLRRHMERGCPRGPNGSVSSSPSPPRGSPVVVALPRRCLPKHDMRKMCSCPTQEPLASMAITRASRSSTSPSLCRSVARSWWMVSFMLDCAELRCVRSCSSFLARSASSFCSMFFCLSTWSCISIRCSCSRDMSSASSSVKESSAWPSSLRMVSTSVCTYCVMLLGSGGGSAFVIVRSNPLTGELPARHNAGEM
mmetsp:Transcript_40592/g.114970  ORF Transcript_40592/g.114970 Transcript_40592/m.114970 type:complete len:213 (-) Transcript_40592:146-784(-)